VTAWCGPLFLAVFAVGLVPLAGFLPPPHAYDPPQQVVALYAEHHGRVLAGLVVMMTSTTLYGPWVGAITARLRGPDGKMSVYGYGQLAAGGAMIIVVDFPVIVMIVASFRIDRLPELIVTLNDLAWILFVINFPPLAAQMLTVAAAIFGGLAQGLPRWLAHFSLWCVILVLPQAILPFFKDGPFAWHGLFGFWAAALGFFGWCTAVSFCLIKNSATPEAAG
jgi:hypothetical protein